MVFFVFFIKEAQLYGSTYTFILELPPNNLLLLVACF